MVLDGKPYKCNRVVTDNDFLIDNMKQFLSNVPPTYWVNQAKCGSDRQYLKELLSADSLRSVCNQAITIIDLYMKNFVTLHYSHSFQSWCIPFQKTREPIR